MGMTLALICIVIRWRALVIKVGVVYVNVHISRSFKEELAWAIDKWLWVISNTMLLLLLRI